MKLINRVGRTVPRLLSRLSIVVLPFSSRSDASMAIKAASASGAPPPNFRVQPPANASTETITLTIPRNVTVSAGRRLQRCLSRTPERHRLAAGQRDLERSPGPWRRPAPQSLQRRALRLTAMSSPRSAARRWRGCSLAVGSTPPVPTSVDLGEFKRWSAPRTASSGAGWTS